MILLMIFDDLFFAHALYARPLDTFMSSKLLYGSSQPSCSDDTFIWSESELCGSTHIRGPKSGHQRVCPRD